jgi:hypothetical protein
MPKYLHEVAFLILNACMRSKFLDCILAVRASNVGRSNTC